MADPVSWVVAAFGFVGGAGTTAAGVATGAQIALGVARVGAVIFTVASSVSARKKRKKAEAAAKRQQKELARRLAEQQRRAQERANELSFDYGPAVASHFTFPIADSAASRRMVYGECTLGGIKAYSQVSTGNKLQQVFLLGDGPFEDLTTLFFNDETVTLTAQTAANNATKYWTGNGRWSGKVRLWWHDGTEGQGVNTHLTSKGKWGTSDLLDGISYIVLELSPDLNVFDNGIPAVRCKVKGRKDIYDYRDGSTGYTDNVALCLAHYLTQDWRGVGVLQSEINSEAVSIAADTCDEQVALRDGGTESRYAIGGAINLTDEPETIRGHFEQCMAGGSTYTEGQWYIWAGAWREPTFTVTEDMIVAPITRRVKNSRVGRANAVKGACSWAGVNYELTDFPTQTNADYAVEDGAYHVLDWSLPYVTSHQRAQRLAKIELERRRFEETVVLTCNLRTLPLVAGGTTYLTLPRHGLEGVRYFVDVWALAIQPGGAPAIQLTLNRMEPTVFDWVPELDEIQMLTPGALENAKEQVATPTATPAGSDISGPTNVTISCATADANIRWSKTVAPLTPSQGTEVISGGVVSVDEGDTLYVRAFFPGMRDSDLLTEGYT